MKLIEKFRAASKKAVSASADLQLAVEELRGELFRLQEEQRQINDTPRSREEIAATISTKFDDLESEALSRLIPVAYSTAREDQSRPDPDGLFRIGKGHPGVSHLEGIGALCVLGLRPTMEAALLERIVESCKTPGISASERSAKLRKIETEINDIERAEEQLIREAEAVGIVVHRRHDARPEIYLAEKV